MSVPLPRARLAVEYVLVFFGLVGAYALVDGLGSPIPVLIVFGAVCVVYLRRSAGFDRRNFGRPESLRPALPNILAVWAIAAVLLVAAIVVINPHRLFSLPRQSPLLWAAVMVFYPLVSVYPQEVIFRAFLLRRYAPVFGTGRLVAAASAVAFGFAHIIYGNVLSVLLTVIVGWLFARRYQRTQSLLTTSVEHALYGILAFTVGIGDLFYHGAL